MDKIVIPGTLQNLIFKKNTTGILAIMREILGNDAPSESTICLSVA